MEDSKVNENPYLKILGEISVEPLHATDSIRTSRTIMMMGPTGAGKSSFIEVLSGKYQQLGISKNQLSGYTQDVNAYRLRGVKQVDGPEDTSPLPICLIDTPGFSDSKISELEIVTKVKTWMADKGIEDLNHILYFCPITDTRLPGSKRRTIKMMQLLRGNSSEITVVTTMWDQLSNPRAHERAESHCAQLRDDIWKELTDNGSTVERFHNDQASALTILNTSLFMHAGGYPFKRQPPSRRDDYSRLLYEELLDRIDRVHQVRQNLWFDLQQLHSNPHAQLESIFRQQLDEAEQDRRKFLSELINFGRPPDVFETVPERVIYQDLCERCNEAQQDQQMLEDDLGRLRAETGDNEAAILKLTAKLEETRRRFKQFSKMLQKCHDPPTSSETRKILQLTLTGVAVPFHSAYSTDLKARVEKGVNFMQKALQRWR